ncbi:MAG: nicotinate (nicotinamide) nucleotide adenylyltransferase [Chlorobiaceae bacterium]|nr:nicotinate (nicotinamide) nucleotide adenylyltransferase [Chlorobiaceae bacterium]
MNLAVFGGTFDPPHNGHLALCLFARELFDIDRIIISVSNNPLKKTRGATDSHRKHMAELLAAEINLTGLSCEVSGWELEKRQPSYTVDLLRHIKNLYPDAGITLLIGEDSFREFPLWKEHETLCSLYRIAVFRRITAEKESVPAITVEGKDRQENVTFIDFTYPVSSTDIREFAATGRSIESLVPPSIRRYITDQGLYRK